MSFELGNCVFIPAFEGGGLGDGGGVDEHILLEGVDGFDEGFGYDHPSQPPSCHWKTIEMGGYYEVLLCECHSLHVRKYNGRDQRTGIERQKYSKITDLLE